MAGMHHALLLAARILVGIVGAIAFYFAFFLYEDEEGAYQNRIEALWITINDRAEITNSTSVAIFNRIGEVFRRVFSHLFGTRLLSLQSVLVSINLSITFSLWGSGLQAVYAVFVEHDEVAVAGIALATPGFIFLFFAFLATKSQNPHVVQASAVLTTLTLIIGCLFIWALIGFAAVGSMGDIDEPPTIIAGSAISFIVLFVSVLADFVVMIIARKLFAIIARSMSILRILFAEIIFIALALSAEGLPYIIGKHLHRGHGGLVIALKSFMLLNLSTVLYCIVPFLFLLMILLHRVSWPLLSRLLYPIASRRLVTNKKALIAIGSLAVAFAFIGHVSLKEILGLFK